MSTRNDSKMCFYIGHVRARQRTNVTKFTANKSNRLESAKIKVGENEISNSIWRQAIAGLHGKKIESFRSSPRAFLVNVPL